MQGAISDASLQLHFVCYEQYVQREDHLAPGPLRWCFSGGLLPTPFLAECDTCARGLVRGGGGGGGGGLLNTVWLDTWSHRKRRGRKKGEVAIDWPEATDHDNTVCVCPIPLL